MTLDEARALAFAEPWRGTCPSQAAYARATEAREQLVYALGEALRPDPPMRIVQAALRRAEEYRDLITAIVERPREPVEMTPAEAIAMMSWLRPSRPRALAPPPVVGPPHEEWVTEAPRGKAPDNDLAYQVGYWIGTVAESLARGVCGLWRRRTA